MNTLRSKKLMTMLLIGALAAMVPRWAMAAGTAACTVVSNTATLSYSVGGTGQPSVSNTAGSADFTVGNKVIVTVEKTDSAAVTVVPGSTTASLISGSKWLTYTVTNTGNALQDYTLAPTTPTGTASPFAGDNADSFDVSGVTVYVETNGATGYQAGADTDTTINDLDPTATLAGESVAGTRTVYIVPSGTDPAIPTGQANSSTAVYILEATSLKGNGDPEANSASATIYKIGGGNCSAAVQFAEGIHTTNKSGEAANDGKDTARDTFKVATAVISVNKTSAVYSDPINGTGSGGATAGTYTASTWTACVPGAGQCPKAIPGAVVRYKVSISNAAGGASATLTSISDVLVSPLQIVSTSGGASWSVTGSTRTTTNGTLTADADAADGLSHSAPASPGGTLAATMTSILATDAGNGYAAGELKAGETVNIVFDVTIQ